MTNFFEKLKNAVGNKKEGEKENKDIQKNKIKINDEGEKWLEPEGELTVDMYQTEKEIIIVSPIAGIKEEDLNLYVEGDVLFIEGERKNPTPREERGEELIKECYWGKFSRKIVLPAEIETEGIVANFQNGILIVKIPKLSKERKKKIVIK